MVHEIEVEELPDNLLEMADMSIELWEKYQASKLSLGRAEKTILVTKHNRIVDKFNAQVGWKQLIKLS